MAAMLGALPMSIGYGSGGEARRPLGLAVVGGLVFSQLVTLYMTPVVYIYMDALMARLTSWKRPRKELAGKLVSVEP
jgi:HAE1 family hydrophobic/amphiphilic exporter-1